MKLINVPDLSPPDDGFTCLELREKVSWLQLSGLPANAVERRIKAFKLSRYRAAAQAAFAARPDDVVISHHPLMSTAAAIALRSLRRRARHIAFAFNFTTLPTGMRRKLVSYALADVEQFAVFSVYEKEIYPDLFDLDPARFHSVVWTQPAPPYDPGTKFKIAQPFVCAIGGEGRDIDLVIEAARNAPKSLGFVLITRPHLIKDKDIPENVTTLVNLPLKDTWTIAFQSLGVLIPLITSNTCCGHITIVSAKQIGLPILTTHSQATTEYVQGRESILLSDPKDRPQFSRNIEKLLDERDKLRSIANDAIASEVVFHSRQKWALYLDQAIFGQNKYAR